MAHNVAPKAVMQFCTGIDEPIEDCNDFPLESIVAANGIFEAVDFYHPDLESGLNSKHWLMEANPRDELVCIWSAYPPGTMLGDRVGHYFFFFRGYHTLSRKKMW